jgi:hypothetical protein
LIYNEDEPETIEGSEFKEPGEGITRFETVPYQERPEEELYAFRESLTSPDQAPQKVRRKIESAGVPVVPQQIQEEKKKPKYLFALATIGCIGLAIIAVVFLQQQGSAPPPYVDLGSTSVTNSGLSGDFVARWVGKANYVFYVNPLSAGDLAGFSAVAANPPRQIVFNVHLKDSSSATICEKEIVFPFKAPEGDNAVPTQGPPARSMDGDEINYERGDHGEIVRIEMKGPMNCSAKSYERIAAWDFTSTYPVKGDQDDWVSNLEKSTNKETTGKKAKSGPAGRNLAAPIDGDDVVVGDNPSRGLVETRAGREFFVGPGGLSTRGQGWGFFPAAIHFHCDEKANCTLTRSGASAVVTARLMK